MMRGLMLATLAIALAGAQPQTTPAADAAISGVVKDFGTGQPLANYNVSTYVNVTWLGDTLLMGKGKQVQSVTDDEGRYRIPSLPPGPYRLEATDAKGFGNEVERRVTLSGQDLDHIDFRVKVTGSISGKILDENKEPVPGITVYLVSREYYSGVLGYFYKSQGVTNDRGEYALQRVQAGHPYLLMAENTVRRMPAYSETPLDPRLRRRAPMRTYYPNSTTREGGSFVSIRPGEHHEGIDIEVKRTQNYCISGMVDGPGGPSGLNFGIEGTQPAYGQSSTGACSEARREALPDLMASSASAISTPAHTVLGLLIGTKALAPTRRRSTTRWRTCRFWIRTSPAFASPYRPAWICKAK
jgi:hypothetical protein